MMEMEFAGFKSLNESELTEVDGGGGVTGAIVAGPVLVGTGLVEAGYNFGKWCQGAWNNFF